MTTLPRLVLFAACALTVQPPSPLCAQSVEVAIREAAAPLRELVESDQVLGMVVYVQKDDRVLLHEAWGHRDAPREQPIQKHTLFRMASNTKAVTAAAVLTLVESGDVGLDDPIARWFPTFGDGLGARITVRQLLTHSSGLRIPTLFCSPLMTPSEEHPDAPNLVLECMRFGEVGPAVEPGTSYSYNNPGYNLCAALVEVVTGQNFADYCRTRFYEPLGMRDTCHHETVADNDRMSAVARRDGERWRPVWSPGGPATVPFVRGSGGLISTAADFASFARVFVTDGQPGDHQVLTPASVRAATRDQLQDLEADYGFGWTIEGDGRFSHGGSDGTWAWCDREQGVVGLVFTQTQGCSHLDPVRDTFRQAVTAALAAR